MLNKEKIPATIIPTFFECELQFYFKLYKIQHKIPFSPDIILGKIQHKMREKYNYTKNFYEEWNKIENLIKDDLQSRNQPEIIFFPLYDNIKNYSLEKEKLRIILNKKREKKSRLRSNSKLFPEMRLESISLNIIGIADLVIKNNERITIIEYKKNILIDKKYLRIYKLQLEIYSYLYYEQFGVWPNSLVLIDNNQKKIHIKINKVNILRYLIYFNKKYIPLNNKELNDINKDKFQYKYAFPDIDVCIKCNYRSNCIPYKRRLTELNNDHRNIFQDRMGILLNVTKPSNNIISIQLKSLDTVISIRNILITSYNIDIELNIGNIFIAYNIIPTKDKFQYNANKFTTLLLIS